MLNGYRKVVRRWETVSINEAHKTLTRISKTKHKEIDVTVILKQIVCCMYVLLMVDYTDDSRYHTWIDYVCERFNYIGTTDVPDIVLTHVISAILEYATDVYRYGAKETTYSFIVDRLTSTIQNCYPNANSIFDKKWRKLYAR